MTVRALRSPAASRNPEIRELARELGEDNGAWLARAAEKGLVESGPEWSLLLLVGGNDPLSFRLRVAQSHVRHDLSPSAWSHAAFVRALERPVGASPTREVSLAPRAGFAAYGFPLPSNGLQHDRLEPYLSRDLFPNVALLSAPVPAAQIEASLRELELARALLDVPALILKWLAYGWGVGVPASPLAEGLGMPAAAVLEAAFGARDFDLSPGLESRASCPEAIWQSALWWHEFHARSHGGRAIRGVFSATHDLVPDSRYGGSPVEPRPEPREDVILG